jgi:hypothetical protein
VALQPHLQSPPQSPARNSTRCRPGAALQRIGNLIAGFYAADVSLISPETGPPVPFHCGAGFPRTIRLGWTFDREWQTIGSCMRVFKTILKWCAALVGVVVVAFIVFSWRDSKEGEDWISCKMQASDREDARSSEPLSPDQKTAIENQFTDSCMKQRGHGFIGGRFPFQCSKEHTSMCYSLF